ncbi:MAG: hypothetical protein KDK71_08890 [Chlamydiia bacterium]|nr:hypothetical protein [Chlamydiia bacterium]
MSQFFFSGSTYSKLDDKNRFVLPQQMRYGLVENGNLEFTIALGLGGSLAIYKRSDIDRIVKKFQEKQHVARYQKFFTLFFSTLHHCTCDKLGRVVLPPVLKKAAKINTEIVIAGVLNKIEIWPKEKYEFDLDSFLEGADSSLTEMTEEAFALLEEGESKTVDQELEACEPVA